METAHFLRTVPLFARLDDAELQRFAELTREKNYPKGSVIVFEDDPGDSLFIVREGRVKVVLIGEDGREVILGVLGVGEYFGELSLIDDQPTAYVCRGYACDKPVTDPEALAEQLRQLDVKTRDFR